MWNQYYYKSFQNEIEVSRKRPSAPATGSMLVKADKKKKVLGNGISIYLSRDVKLLHMTRRSKPEVQIMARELARQGSAPV